MNKNANVNMKQTILTLVRKQTSLTFETLYIFEFVILIDHAVLIIIASTLVFSQNNSTNLGVLKREKIRE